MGFIIEKTLCARTISVIPKQWFLMDNRYTPTETSIPFKKDSIKISSSSLKPNSMAAETNSDFFLL